jgi:hypothetical protein
MRLEDRASPKLMFILTAAFGELFNAMYMVTGCGFHTAFAMREPWYSLNHDTLPGASYRFDNLAELLTAIDQEQPDLVCLFSGYLYASDNLIDFDELDHLIRHLKNRGIRSVTSDPFLGLISRLPPLDLETPIGQIIGLPIRMIGEAMLGSKFSYFLRARVVLKDVPHVYIVDPNEHGITALPFYNPNIRRPAASCGPGTSVPAMPYWLFVLGSSDYNPQVKRDGANCVHALVARKLTDTMNEGRRAVLMAPEACIAALEKDPALGECSLVRNCNYDRYMEILLCAEYTFYWNIFSASIIARLLNRLPTFFFATGHIAEENRQMFEKGMDQYYRNAHPAHLQPGDRLSAAALSVSALAQMKQLFDPFLENVRHLPTPQRLVHDLLAQRQPS